MTALSLRSSSGIAVEASFFSHGLICQLLGKRQFGRFGSFLILLPTKPEGGLVTTDAYATAMRIYQVTELWMEMSCGRELIYGGEDLFSGCYFDQS